MTTILDAIKDPNLFRPFLADEQTGSIKTWATWSLALRCLYGLPMPRSESASQFVEDCTGRDASKMPKSGFTESLLLCGRRSGKSRITSLIAAYEAILAGNEKKLAKGESGLVAICSTTMRQAGIIKKYFQKLMESSEMLKREVVAENNLGFELRNGIRCEILAGDYRSVRGFTVIAAIVDELAHFQTDATRVRSDTELVRALLPSLASCKGRFLGLSTPYARAGYCWETYEANYGNNAGDVLVWQAPSTKMNSTLDPVWVEKQIAKDPQGGRSEWLAEFRDDVVTAFPRELIDAAIIKDRDRLLPRSEKNYQAFCDMSGGRRDSSTLAIGHKSEDGRIIVDLVREWTPPHSPQSVVANMCDVLREYNVRKIMGDNYSGEWVASAFKSNRIQYVKCPLPKSQLYLEMLVRLCDRVIELPDNQRLITQLQQLERRTRSGGKDLVDHPQRPNCHDDLANSCAGISYILASKKLKIGAF